MERQSREEAERLVSEAQSRSDKLMSDTKMQCEEMIAKAQKNLRNTGRMYPENWKISTRNMPDCVRFWR